MYQYLTVEKRDGVAWITFRRPGQLNAMNRVFMDEIVDAFHSVNQDEEVRVVLVTGEGRSFMAGADIKEYASQTDEEFLAFQKKGWQLYDEAEKGEKPFIAVVNGFALGGGFEIAAACDMIIASEEAQFGLPEVHLGLVPGGGGTQRLIQKIGINRVREILYLGGRYTAAKMLEWGIVNYIVPAEQLKDYAQELAAKLARRSPMAIAQLKKLAYLSTCPMGLEERMEEEGKSLYMLFHTPLAQEKIKNFANKK
ncbi:enoyl-CoA hydratase/isomerase family protein [Lacrimispora sp.]|uniref:enoyl-CoA hydratase/isomerase family protein n=1 Tax=Lacrimispora sp. TaxID=2719234 RepID=UPI00346146AD